MLQPESLIRPHDMASRGYAATIGFFDGVHLGHRFLLEKLRHIAAEQEVGSMVITFDRHPRQVVDTQWQPALLTTTEEKARLLADASLDRVVVMPFTEQLARLSAHDFMERVLVGQLGVRVLLTGYDNRFGHRREEGFADYVAYGRELGIGVVQAPSLSTAGLCYSSSMARRRLAEGDVAGAATVLGRCYTLSGMVVHGHEIGRRLGFPTANVQPDDPLKLIPRTGVYAVWAMLHEGHGRLPLSYAAVMNIGHRPTFADDGLTLEVHLLDFAGDLYGRRLTVAFAARLRDERRFGTAADLARQMDADVCSARELLVTPPTNLNTLLL